MARPPRARAVVLDALESLLVEGGGGDVTFEAVARKAAVTKNGVLYHFQSRSDLLNAYLDRAEEVVAADVEAMRVDPDGASRHYLTMSCDPESPVNRSLTAATKMPAAMSDRAHSLIASAQESWRRELIEELGDAHLAALVALAGDGLWLNSSLRSQWPHHRLPMSVDELQAVLVNGMPPRG